MQFADIEFVRASPGQPGQDLQNGSIGEDFIKADLAAPAQKVLSSLSTLVARAGRNVHLQAFDIYEVDARGDAQETPHGRPHRELAHGDHRRQVLPTLKAHGQIADFAFEARKVNRSVKIGKLNVAV